MIKLLNLRDFFEKKKHEKVHVWFEFNLEKVAMNMNKIRIFLLNYR